jgi:ABC-type transport system involved in cytochrome c biogenesis permease subunit
MNWIDFPFIVLITAILWIGGLIAVLLAGNRHMVSRTGLLLLASGTLVMGFFIAALWIHLDRPPLKTMGETRLWYSFFLSAVAILGYLRWKYAILPATGISLALLNLAHPENYERNLMPALQSMWFAPHVIVYMLSYALLGVSAVTGWAGLYRYYFSRFEFRTLHFTDNLVYMGFSLLTLGMLFGALWAKEAWGHYWTWDPKETWALLTWLTYLLYIHFRYHQPERTKEPLWILGISYLILLICYMGLKYLPSAVGSVHVYSNG